VAGIPFTVSLFVAEQALPPGLVEPATVAIILAAAATGLLGFVLVRRSGGRSEPPRDPAPPQVS
jgi:Na+/H+ antiporter NhaA